MSAEERMIEAAIAYLGRRWGPRAQLRTISLEIVGSDGVRQEIRLRANVVPLSHDDGDNVEPGSIRECVLEVLGDAENPLKGQTIARRAGRSYSGTFRAALAAMVREGLLVLGESGYSLSAGESGQDSQKVTSDG